MEVLIFFGGIAIVLFIISAISGAIEKHKQKIRDEIAHKFLDRDFDYQAEKRKLLSVRENLNPLKLQQDYPVLNFLGENEILPEINFRTSRSVCTSCGGKMVKRKGPYGFFWGCSNYPKCRFIRKRK